MPAPPQRVALFGSFAPSLIHFRGPLIQEMVRRGHQVFGLAPAIDAGTAEKLRALGAVPVEVSLGRTSLDPFEAVRTVRNVRAALRGNAIDTMIAYTIKPVGLGGLAAAAEGVRFVPLITGLGYAFTGGREPKRLLARAMGTVMYRRAFKAASAAVFQNPDDLSDFRRMKLLPKGLRAYTIAGSGIDLARFGQVPVPDDVSFVMIARFLRDKGIREYGEAARQLKQLHPHIRVSLIGDVDASPDSINRGKVDEMVRGGIDLVGRVDDVRPALAAHSVYVLPSYREGTPRSVLEALSVGRAVITTDAPGCRETVVEGKNGFLVPPRSTEALLEAMLRFVENPGLAKHMGLASRRIAERKYDVRKVSADLLGVAGL